MVGGDELFFVFLFAFLLCTGLSEVVILSADNWVCIFVLFVVWMRHPSQGATGDWCCMVLYSVGFFCGCSHYLILPRVSSLVV